MHHTGARFWAYAQKWCVPVPGWCATDFSAVWQFMNTVYNYSYQEGLSMRPLTARQAEVLQLIRDFVQSTGRELSVAVRVGNG